VGGSLEMSGSGTRSLNKLGTTREGGGGGGTGWTVVPL
jgi:hypothetical protein